MDYFFGLRFAVTIILYITLGSSIISATNTQNLLSPMILFLLPIALDYYSHNPIENKNITRKKVGVWSPIILAAIIVGFQLNQFELFFIINSTLLKFLCALPFLGYVILAGMDWSAYSSPTEKEHREKIRRIMRSQVFPSPQKRVKDYNKAKGI